MADFNLDTIPLAIVRRLDELDTTIKSLEGLNERDAADIAELRDQITKIKGRIEARTPDVNDLLNQREMLAFAVKAYQDEAPVKVERVVLGPKAAELAAPPQPRQSASLKERVADAIRSAGYPIKAAEIADSLGCHWRTVAQSLGVLSAAHRIVPAKEGGWLAASGQE